ncbi:MAG: hypothetical protein HC914_15965 [Chloroflexaceae bacterium]|nr:hypothetical protein [Chloroflexaceae bacterium]
MPQPYITILAQPDDGCYPYQALTMEGARIVQVARHRTLEALAEWCAAQTYPIYVQDDTLRDYLHQHGIAVSPNPLPSA